MFKDWFYPEIKKIGFEDVKYALSVQQRNNTLMINRLDILDQGCLIKGTLHAQEEERTMNQYIDDGLAKTRKIIVYGMNACDDRMHSKCRQLQSLGFLDVETMNFRRPAKQWIS